jgi:2-polyprenyl-3-methyl-5-hydroxy-6-metoxy-1,4-benzoquinol methylase
MSKKQTTTELYASKPDSYFNGARLDYVAALPANPAARILEIGCGTGATGAAALAAGKCASYHGVELCSAAAVIARTRLTDVVVGDVEQLDDSWTPGTFDVLILSEVLEHLADPWRVLRNVRRAMRPGSLVFASSPNVAHWRIITMLLRGDWGLTDRGTMDRTHLRWFTPVTYGQLFEACGFVVDELTEVRPLGIKGRAANAITGGRVRHLFATQIALRAHRP